MEFKYNNIKIINLILTALVVALLVLMVYKIKQPRKVEVGQVWSSELESDFYDHEIYMGKKSFDSYDSIIAIDGLDVVYINLNSGDTMKSSESQFLKFNHSLKSY